MKAKFNFTTEKAFRLPDPPDKPGGGSGGSGGSDGSGGGDNK